MKTFLLKQFLAGTKTMTRRTGGLEAVNEEPENWVYSPMFSAKGIDFMFKSLDSAVFLKPRYNKGEVVFIKEGYLPYYHFGGGTAYKSDWTEPTNLKFKNKLFMPASEARYFALIEDVYPQRLQDITEEDAVKEGVETHCDYKDVYKFYSPLKHYTPTQLDGGVAICYNARRSFATLIDSINVKGTWDKNHWVWVYKIKQVEKPF